RVDGAGDASGHARCPASRTERRTVTGTRPRSTARRPRSSEGPVMPTRRKITTIPAQGSKPAISFHQGGLHESTGTPSGQPISAAKPAAAAAGRLGPKAEKQENFFENVLRGRGRGR